MKKCELLVPAGGSQQLIAAVENGADAVYLGGKLFNARINAGNFDDAELKAGVAFAHKRGVKVYVTMNTLVTDEELAAALSYAGFLYGIGVDALIVQDLGLGKLVKEALPAFPLHLSTQGSVYDAAGVEAAYRLGYERVVLARELSFAEIEAVCQSTSAEIEVFVHGALCICYSGQCQMSRHFGGRSGNRGQCAQPCRLPYKTLDAQGKRIDTFAYPLSPKDLCTIDHIGALAEAGVCSLKIEGRMKSAAYVAIVTSIYRKYLDLYYKQGTFTVTEEDREALAQIFNRGGFTEGYFYENPEQTLMAGDIPKHRGIRIGKVVKAVQGGSLVDVKLYAPLALGDGVEIQGEQLTGNVVTYYKALKSGLVRIGDIKGSVRHGDPLYKITSKAQMKAAQQTFFNKTFDEGKYLRKTPVDMVCTVDASAGMTLQVKSPLLQETILVQEAAQSYDLCTAAGDDTDALRMDGRMEKALRKTGSTPFSVGKVEILNPQNLRISVSAINGLRREALRQLEDAFAVGRTLPKQWSAERVCASFDRETDGAPSCKALEFYFYDWESFVSYIIPPQLSALKIARVSLLPAAVFHHHFEEIGENSQVIPYITPISKGKEDAYIELHFEEICRQARSQGIYVGNLKWIQPFQNAGVPVFGDFGLNVYNRAASLALARLGIRHSVGSLEGISAGFGAFPLMLTEHHVPGRYFIDRKKERIGIIARDFSDQILLISEDAAVDFAAVKEAVQQEKGIVRIYVKPVL